MPLILLAGTVTSPPKSFPFPTKSLPYASVTIDADDVEYRVIAHDLVMAELECLQLGDAISIQGSLVLVNQGGKLAGIYIVAKQVTALRSRSKNRLPVAMASHPML